MRTNRHEPMATALSIVKILVVAYAGYLGLIFAMQRRMAFPGTLRVPPRASMSAPEGVEQVWLDTSFGRVEAWFLTAPDPAVAPTVVFAHGNGELIDDWLGDMRRLPARGVNALLVEFPGYGHSDGAPTRATIAETFDAAFDWLLRREGVDRAKIVAYGRSLGGGAAADLARSRPVAALVLQSTFASAAAIAREQLVPGFVVRDRFDNAAMVGAMELPVLLMHGRTDEVISWAHAERIAEAREGLVITEIPCGHNDCASAWPDIVSALTEFLERHHLLER